MKFFKNSIILSEFKGELEEEKNYIENEDKKYNIRYLTDGVKGSKGGNSNVYLLYDKQGKEVERVIKISNNAKPERKSKENAIRRHGRFINEIKALYDLRDKGKSNIVSIIFDGEISVKDDYGNDKVFPYYVMEKADTDLKDFLLDNKDIDEQEKISFCLNIFDSLRELHEEGYYHRDIKPDNILLFYEDSGRGKAVWKIGDLGLSAHRDKDYDDIGEKIGPFGWLSPEAMNKYLTEKSSIGFDCLIDDKSDIFQLGKLFWFIFQQNVPIGQVCFDDFICNMRYKKDTFDLINIMLTYSKSKRADSELVGYFLNDLGKKYAVK